MALPDEIEYYGHAVDVGEMTRAEAAVRLADASNGGLTQAGAEDLIDNWRTVRDRYDDGLNRTFHALAAIKNGRKPHPSGRPTEQ